MTTIPDAELEQEIADWPDRLDRLAEESGWIQRVTVLARTESTQDAVSRCGSSPGTLVVAGRQTGGRGRRGRKWTDDLGRGVALSLAVEAEDPAFLCARAAVALANAFVPLIRDRGIRAGIKWPNDLVAIMDRPRKLAGVLVEKIGRQTIVGLGVNVRSRSWPEELRDSAGTLEDAGVRLTRLETIVRLLECWLDAMMMSKDQLHEAFAEADILDGEWVVVEESGTLHEGVVRAVDPFKGVLLATREGEVHLRPELTRIHSWEGHVNHGGEWGVDEPM